MSVNHIIVYHKYFAHPQPQQINHDHRSQPSDAQHQNSLLLYHLLIPVFHSDLPVERPIQILCVEVLSIFHLHHLCKINFYYNCILQQQIIFRSLCTTHPSIGNTRIAECSLFFWQLIRRSTLFGWMFIRVKIWVFLCSLWLALLKGFVRDLGLVLLPWWMGMNKKHATIYIHAQKLNLLISILLELHRNWWLYAFYWFTINTKSPSENHSLWDIQLWDPQPAGTIYPTPKYFCQFDQFPS